MKKTHTIGLLTTLAVTLIGLGVSSNTIFATNEKEIAPVVSSEGQTTPKVETDTQAPQESQEASETSPETEDTWIYGECHNWANTEEGRAWHESMHEDGQHQNWMDSEEGQEHHRGMRGNRGSEERGTRGEHCRRRDA